MLYSVTYNVQPHLIAVIPAACCGILGGVLGSLFTILNVKVGLELCFVIFS